jgi:hypothetical protein
VKYASGILQDNLHLQACLQSRSCGPAKGRSNPSISAKLFYYFVSGLLLFSCLNA